MSCPTTTRGAGRARAHRLPDRRRPGPRARRAADAAPAARALAPGPINRFERVLVWCHWVWFMVPHASVLYVFCAAPSVSGAAAARMYAVFDLGADFYWVDPDGPALVRRAAGPLRHGRSARVRRMMIEYGEQFWGGRWPDLYDVLGGNPLAAMPSLHFATSLMGARLLSEVGPVAGAVGWSYAAHAGAGAGLSGRALRRGPGRRGGAGRERAPGRTAPGPGGRRLARMLVALEHRAAGG